MLTSILLLALGLYLLVRGADWLVDGSVSLARRFGWSELFIGLTIIAFGTSMPELVVNLVSVTSGAPEVAIGNVIGSNVANIFLILGVCAIIAPLRVQSSTVWKEIPFSLLASVAVLFLGFDTYFGSGVSMLVLGDGLMLVAIFLVYLWYLVGIARSSHVESEISEHKDISPLKAGVFIFAGLALLVLGGKVAVASAIDLALALGLSASFIALTVVAVGTSLPELATSVVATRKGQDDIAVGNIVGSNIFNIFWILGLSAVITPLPFAPSDLAPVLVAGLASIVLFSVCFIGKRHIMQRWQGWVFVAMYAGYVAFLLA